MHATIIVEQPVAIVTELEELGLEVDDLRLAVQAGDSHRAGITLHHPNYYLGIGPQSETVKVLRDRLIPKGWIKHDIRNSPRALRADKLVSIAVHSGDEGTGIVNAAPRTRTAKGQITQNDVMRNAMQRDLPMEIPVSIRPRRVLDAVQAVPETMTWFLLFFCTGEEVRYELSLPVSWDEDDHVSAWRKRIILPPFPSEPGPRPRIKKPSDENDIDVPVVRKMT